MRYKLTNNNICNGRSSLDELIGDHTVDIVYSDLPWGDGSLKYWGTMNKKMSQANTSNVVSFEIFLKQIFNLIDIHTKNGAICFLENGVRYRAIIQKMIKKQYKFYKLIKTRYNTTLPADLHIFSSKELPIFTSKNETGLSLLRNTLGQVIKKDDVVLDMCCGLGKTAKVTLEKGGIFLGNDINKARLDRTLELIKRMEIKECK